jgi:hypothetical protein
VKGEVAHHTPPVGFGIRFLDLSERQLRPYACLSIPERPLRGRINKAGILRHSAFFTLQPRTQIRQKRLLNVQIHRFMLLLAGRRTTPLRLRALTIQVDESGNRLEYFPISKLTRLDHLTSSIERREIAEAKGEVRSGAAGPNLSLLDTEAGEPLESLILHGAKPATLAPPDSR